MDRIHYYGRTPSAKDRAKSEHNKTNNRHQVRMQLCHGNKACDIKT